MSEMFESCYELEYLDLSNFDVSNVTNMDRMFADCRKLKHLKLNLFFYEYFKNCLDWELFLIENGFIFVSD